MDDLCYNSEFNENKKIKRIKIDSEGNRFKYIRINVEQMEQYILPDQIQYVKQEECPEIKRYKDINSEKMTKYKAMVGRLNWQAQHTRSEISVEVSFLRKASSKEKQAT